MDQDVLRDAAAEVLSHADRSVVAAYLFGSVARATATTSSDIDIAVLLRSAEAKRLDGVRLTLEGQLEAALRRTVQLVVLNQAPSDLVHRVLRDGVIILDRDRAARIRFEVRARNMYFDLLPVLKEYRHAPVSTP
jgi:predicted nucleotidyltransferase